MSLDGYPKQCGVLSLPFMTTAERSFLWVLTVQFQWEEKL
jgi:hypothetical protein